MLGWAPHRLSFHTLAADAAAAAAAVGVGVVGVVWGLMANVLLLKALR